MAVGTQTATQVTSRLLTLAEAASYLRQSERNFRRHVAKSVYRVRIGARFFYDKEDLDQWVEEHKVGPSYLPNTLAVKSSTSGSGTGDGSSLGPRGRQILQELRNERRPSGRLGSVSMQKEISDRTIRTWIVRSNALPARVSWRSTTPLMFMWGLLSAVGTRHQDAHVR